MWSVKDSLMWSLGTFTPDLPEDPMHFYREHRVASEFARFLDARCTPCEQQPDVRSPNHDFAIRNIGRLQPLNWHHDGSAYSRRCYMACWSNGVQTEIRDPVDGTVYQAAPGEVILFHNFRLEHRAPRYVRSADRQNRWFARCSFPLSGKVKDVPGVYALELASGRLINVEDEHVADVVARGIHPRFPGTVARIVR